MSKESIILLSTTNTLGNFTSDIKKGSGYHMIDSGLHTVVVSFVNWSGELFIQATLVVEPTESDWFTVATFGDASTDYDDAQTVNITGNYVWLRATGSITDGEITEIRYNY